MIALCLVSTDGQVGKTAIGLGIARKLQGDGKKVGYFKPFSVTHKDSKDTDCAFAVEALELGKPSESLCPVVIPEADFSGAGKNAAELAKKAQQAWAGASKDCDVVVVELPSARQGTAGAALAGAFLGTVSAKVLLVLGYGTSLTADAGALDAAVKAKLAGIVINGVPSNRMADKAAIAAGLPAPVLGAIPQDRALMGISVREVIEAVGAQPVEGNGSGDIVENVMVGASVVDHGPTYFERKSNKAVLVRGERPDMQLAALETPTKVLVLTGGVKPIDQVLKQARRRKVPVALTGHDTQTALGEVTSAVARARFSQRPKLTRIEELLGANLDFKSLGKAAGL